MAPAGSHRGAAPVASAPARPGATGTASPPQRSLRRRKPLLRQLGRQRPCPPGRRVVSLRSQAARSLGGRAPALPVPASRPDVTRGADRPFHGSPRGAGGRAGQGPRQVWRHPESSRCCHCPGGFLPGTTGGRAGCAVCALCSVHAVCFCVVCVCVYVWIVFVYVCRVFCVYVRCVVYTVYM